MMLGARWWRWKHRNVNPPAGGLPLVDDELSAFIWAMDALSNKKALGDAAIAETQHWERLQRENR